MDFIISKGTDKTVCEIKLSTNTKCKQGYIKQIREYATAERTDNMVFVLINLDDSDIVKDIELLNKEDQKNKVIYPKLIVINAMKKPSASKI